MKKIKNFDALLKCGFEKIADHNKYALQDEKYYVYAYCEYGILEFTKHSSNDFIIEKTIQMTKAGCFDEPVKTLSELGWKLINSNDDQKLFTNSFHEDAIHCIVIMKDAHTTYYMNNDSDKRKNWYPNINVTKAIMLEMEEQNENK